MPLDPPAENFSRLEERVERWRWALRSAAGSLALRKFPALAGAALEMAAQRFHAASLPHIFSTDLREIPPALNEDLLDLYGRSEQILANRFSFFHSTKSFGAKIDWQAGAGSAWNRELHSFDFALDVALTYRISREERYAQHLRYLIADWVSANPPAGEIAWETETLAKRVRNWVLASDLARDDWNANPDFLQLVLHSLALQYVILTESDGLNQSCESCGNGFRARLWRERGLAFLEGMFPLDGSKRIAWRLPQIVEERLDRDAARGDQSLRPVDTLQAAEALLDELVLESPGTDSHAGAAKEALQRILNALEAMMLPDGTLPLFGREATPAAENLQNIYATAAVLFAEPRWKAIAGQWGIIPHMLLGEGGWRSFSELKGKSWTPASSSQPQSGICRLVGNGSSALAANLRPRGSASDHQDDLSFELMIRGHRVVVDSGAYRPPGDAEGQPFARPEAHNVLMLEADRGMGRGENAPMPISFRRIYGDGWVAFSAECKATSHQRIWALTEANAWVVLDRLLVRQAKIGRLTSLLHFFPTFELGEEGDRVLACSRALTVTVVPFGPVPCTTRFTKGDDEQIPGWYAPEFGTRFPSSVLALEWAAAPGPFLCGYALVEGKPAGVHFGDADRAAGRVDLWAAEKCFKISFVQGLSQA
jgi:uncharacterized heparinase superfamily protein